MIITFYEDEASPRHHKAAKTENSHTVPCICQRRRKPPIFADEAVGIEIIRIVALREVRHEYETRMRNPLKNPHKQSDRGLNTCGHRSDPPTDKQKMDERRTTR